MLTNCGKQTSVEIHQNMAEYKSQLVLAKAILPIYPTQTKPKPKSRKRRQLEVAANKPGQKSMKDFFNSSISVKNEPGTHESKQPSSKNLYFFRKWGWYG